MVLGLAKSWSPCGTLGLSFLICQVGQKSLRRRRDGSATVKGLLVVMLLLDIWVPCLGFCHCCGLTGGPALALVGLNGLCRQPPPNQAPCSALYSGCSHSSFIRSRPTLPPGKRGGKAVAWIPQGACAGRPAALNAPDQQQLSDKEESTPPPHSGSAGDLETTSLH